MKSLTIFIFLSMLAFGCFSQQDTRKTDSLRNLLQAGGPRDSSRVRNLLNLSYNLVYENPDTSMVLANEALELAGSIKWQKGIALSLREKGLIYYFQSDFLNAIDYSQQALKQSEPLQDKLFDASVFNNIANVYADMGQSQKALEFYQELLSTARQIRHKTYEMNAWANIASIYVELGDYDKAIETQKKALEISTGLKDDNIAAIIYNNMGTAYRKKGNDAEAMNAFHLSLVLAKANANNNVIADALSNMAKLYAAKGKYDSARAYAMQSLGYSKQINALQPASEAYETLSIIHEKQNRPAAALDAYKQFILLRDSLLNVEKRQEITRKEMRFDAEKKEAVLTAEHRAEIKRQRTIKEAAILGGLILLIAGIVSFVFYKRKTEAVTRQQEAELKTEIGETQMKALRSQMNPHFIFNSLNSISDYISRNDVRSADIFLSKFAKVMRMILENSEQKEVCLKDDLKALELYMQLESLRMNNKFSYEIRIDPEIDIENTMVPPLILQPFVENSIWHGISGKQGPGRILIDIKKQGKMLNCIVEDNGVGRTANEQLHAASEKRSLGMKITRARIDMINKLKNSNAAVNISDLSEGMRAEVSLPLELSF